ncbi:MAG TPA: carbonic anhydrase [Azospirillaceae bacterium]|nr:carbonic anhydrase [Azospirillaceae bacterium]
MDRLLEGYRRFRTEVWPAERDRYETLATKGQSPETLVIACSDSRVDPQTVFGAGPGEIFQVRNVAALVPPYQPDANYHGTSAAVEYAVRVLKVKRIVVLGHAQCGGVRAMVERTPLESLDFVGHWMGIAADTVCPPAGDDLDLAEVCNHCEAEVIRLSLDNLMTFPWVAEAVNAGRLKLQGCRFDIHTGVLMMLEGDRLVPVA